MMAQALPGAGDDALDRAPDCTSREAASVAGIVAAAVMAGALDIGSAVLPDDVALRVAACATSDDFRERHAVVGEGFRVAGLMISARARASVRTPSRAALSAAEAALALAEDWLDARVGERPDLADAHAVLASIRDALRAGLAALHAADA